MPFSAYLDSKRQDCKALVNALGKYFKYVSILGTDVYATTIRADKRMSMVQDGSGECGFVVKMHDGKAFFEYSHAVAAMSEWTVAHPIRPAALPHRWRSARRPCRAPAPHST